jgi:hypothetical protein
MITNKVPTRLRRMLAAEVSVLYRPVSHQWSYSHHASLCHYRGMLHAIWSNGERDEDDLRQRVLHATSADGKSWSLHEVLFDSQPNKVLTACGLYNSGTALIAYAGSYEYAPENIENGRYKVINDQHRFTTLLAKETTDGEHWEEAIDLGLPIVPNHGPQKLHSGSLMISGNVTFPITDNADGLTGWRMAGMQPFPWGGMQDDSEGLTRHMAMRQDNVFLCEGSFFQTEDDVVHMLLRSDKHVLYETTSTDDGHTWSAPQATEFASCNTKFHCGRLPDGRYYIVGCPDPAGARCPLVISLSKDGQVFDQEYVVDDTFRSQRMPGKYKGGIYGYPHSLIAGETMYIICSINKEDIFVYAFPLDQLK